MSGAVVHSPSYVLRRRLLLRLLGRERPGRLLEVGCGRGELLGRLVARGWDVVGLETSPTAAAVARRAIAERGLGAAIVERPEDVRGRFPVVLASEVLEHLEDDAGALSLWRRWVADGGRLVLTVPAHARYWTPSDERVGHVRRYERAALERLLVRVGYRIELLWSFGFPLTALTVPLRHLVHVGWMARSREQSREERTALSAFASATTLGRPAAWAAEAFGALAHALQLPFLATDLGASYLAVARPEAEVENR